MHNSLRRYIAARAGAAVMIAAISLAPAVAQEDAAAAAQEDQVIATLNGQPITEADLTLAEKELGQQFSQLPPEQRRAAALSAVIDVRLFASEAEEQEIDENEEFQRQIAFLRERALHSAFIDRNVVKNITDEEVRARYDEEVAKLTPPEEVHARHILVESEEEAKEIIEQLNEGGDFAEIAKEKSKDGAAASGGDLGYFTKGRMVPEFEEAAFAMEPGSHSQEPVQTQFGWHVVKVEDKRTQQPPAFEQVQDQIRSLLIRDKYVDTLSTLRGEAEVEIPNEELKAAVDQLFQQQVGQPEAAAGEGGTDAAQ